MSPATIFTYKGREVDPRTVGHDLHVASRPARQGNEVWRRTANQGRSGEL